MPATVVTAGLTVGGLAAEDIVILSSTTAWQVPWELMIPDRVSGGRGRSGRRRRHRHAVVGASTLTMAVYEPITCSREPCSA